MSGAPRRGEDRHRRVQLVGGRPAGTRRRPECTRKHLNPNTPGVASGTQSATLPGTHRPRSRRRRTPARRPRRASPASAATVVVGGMQLSGMSTSVVTPPAAAARVADAKPSHSVRPGSFTCTCVSTSPGISTSSRVCGCRLRLMPGISEARCASMIPSRTATSAGRNTPSMSTRSPLNTGSNGSDAATALARDIRSLIAAGSPTRTCSLTPNDLPIARVRTGEADLAVHVLVEQVAERAGPAGVAGLRAEGAQPHEVAGLDLHPVVVEPVDGLALEDEQPVLHDVGFGERDDPPGWNVTMLTCMSWARSSGSTKRVVAQAPLVSGIGRGSTSWSLVTKDLAS